MKDSLSDEKELLKEKVLLLEKFANQGVEEELPTGFSTVTTWKLELEKNLKSTSDLPKVIESDFQDAEELFKAETAKLTLRKPTIFRYFRKIPDEIILRQFDPNFKSNEVVCRYPSWCENKNPRVAKRIKGVKRDLYLCPIHRELLMDRICLAIEKKNLNFSRSEFATEAGRFEGYTALIGILEGAYHEAKKVPTIRDKSKIVEEAILNVRNFLIITNTVLNPENDNLAVALPPVFHIFLRILENPERAKKILQELISALKNVVETILFAFGVIYTWVSLVNPGTKIGIAAGGICGAVGFVLGPAAGAAGVAVGGILGGLLGSGIHELTERRDQLNIARVRQEWMARGVIFIFEGDEWGALQMLVTFRSYISWGEIHVTFESLLVQVFRFWGTLNESKSPGGSRYP